MIVEARRLSDREISPQQYGVIFIDCWEFDWQWQAPMRFYQGIKQHLARLPIKSKVFHTTCLKLDSLKLDVINYFREFVEKHPKQADNFKSLLDNAGDQTLDPELWELVDWQSIFIPTASTFEEHVVKSGIQHWIVVGSHWGICVHTKPLGLNNLWYFKRKHPKIDFYTIPGCVARWKWSMKEQVAIPTTWQDLHDDSLMWSKYQSGLARLELPSPVVHKPRVKVMTNSPDKLKSSQGWEIQSIESAQPLIDGLLPGRPGSLQMAVRHWHDNPQDDDEYLLFVVDPEVEIDMRDLLCDIDYDHSLFVDPGWRYALYRRDRQFITRFISTNK